MRGSLKKGVLKIEVVYVINEVLTSLTMVGAITILVFFCYLVVIFVGMIEWIWYKRGPKQVDNLSYEVMKLKADVGCLRERVYKIECKEIIEFNKKKGKRWV